MDLLDLLLADLPLLPPPSALSGLEQKQPMATGRRRCYEYVLRCAADEVRAERLCGHNACAALPNLNR